MVVAVKNNIQSKFNRCLPLLKEMEKLFSNINFNSTLIICVQHLYSTTYSLFDSLFKMGLLPENLYVLGKCYSTDPEVLNKLKDSGVNVSTFSASFDSYSNYDCDFDNYVNLLLDKVFTDKEIESFEKVIILDDGGHLIEQISKRPLNSSNIVGIEQTSSGFNRLKDTKLCFPIINMSRSWIKLKYETPIIIKLIKQVLLKNIYNLSTRPHKVLIIGNGTIGQAVGNILGQFFEITFYDKDENKSMIASQDFRKKLKNFDLIVGCSGYTSLTSEDYKYLKRPVILASVSSSDREFDAFYLRKKCKQSFDCHETIESQGITLINSGFPINFSSDYDQIDIDDFQLTRALLLISVCQSFVTNSDKQEFIDIKDEIQSKLLVKLLQLNIN